MRTPSVRPDTPGSRLRSAFIALLVVFFWATSWVLIKIGLEDIPALTFAGLRYTLAFIILLPLAALRLRRSSSPPVPGRVLRQLIVLGLLLYAVTQGAMFVALAYLPAVTVNLLWSFSTVAVALFAIVWLAERPTPFQWMGIALATFGAIVYFFPVDLPQGRLIGVAVSVVGVLANAGAAIMGRGINRSGEFHPLVITAVSMGAGAIILLIVGVSLQGLPRIPPKGWVIVAWLAAINTAVAFTLWNYTLRSLSATESSIINGTMLLWIPILAIVFLGETVTAKELLGLAAAAAGTLIVQLRSPSSLRRLLRRTVGT